MLPKTADIVIIGGGIVGMSIAYHLVKGNAKNVVLLEKEPVFGDGSSGHSAGGIRRLFANAVDILLSQRSLEKIHAFKDEFSTDPEFRAHGYLFLATAADRFDRYKKEVALQNKLGVPSQILEPQGIKELVPQLEIKDILGAMYCPEDGYFDPYPVLMAYQAYARRAGLKSFTDCEVTEIHVDHGRVNGVNTTKGAVDTPLVINAAGPYAGRVGQMAGLDHKLSPRLRQIFMTHPLKPGTLSSGCPPVLDIGLPFYFRPEGKGMILSAAEEMERPLDQTYVDNKSLDHITKCLLHRAPALADCSIQNSWAGFRTLTPSGSALVGPHPELKGYYLACGFCGHGVMHAPAVGEVLAAQILGLSQPAVDISPLFPTT